MSQTAIFQPFFVMLLLTMVVWFVMYSLRIPFIVRQKIPPEQLTPSEFAKLSSPRVANPSDNLKNLFEIPTLFYAVVLYLFVSGTVDQLHLTLAWVFVGFRILHSAVHCTVNVIVVRFWLYCISTFALWFMIVRAGVGLLA